MKSEVPAKLGYGLKEWSIVCDLLLEGRLAILLRKGGIHESSGPGVFELEHGWFALFPSWAHQRPEMIKEAYRERVRVLPEPAEVPLDGFGHAARIWRVPSRAAFDRLETLHCWTKPQIDMRFDYKPQNPLYLMAVRIYRLRERVVVPNSQEYAGCKSWVPFRPVDEPSTEGYRAALSDEQFADVVAGVDRAFA